MHGEHPNAVRLGLALLGGFGSERDEDLFRLFGTDPIFCRATAEALSRCHPAAEHALFALARRSTGWSRVTMVEALTGSTDPEIKEWLIRDACTGDVLDSYFVLAAARTGDLAEVLSRPTLDERTLQGAGEMLFALSDVDGPGRPSPRTREPLARSRITCAIRRRAERPSRPCSSSSRSTATSRARGLRGSTTTA
ncbi:hypothetical protein WKI68_13415 [Streptomyces sp. MS1.HAVA.3]|uniref:Uncharacterized protein n=1 Tax=Streptomyces caledonius TaxID=3134107 RepID=A0ABU8U2T9_9ACTN